MQATYPNFPYFPQSYPQTPHANPAAAPLVPGPNGYPPFYQPMPAPAQVGQPQAQIQPQPQVPYPEQYASGYPLASPAVSGQTDRSKPHRRHKTIGSFPLKSALKQPSTSAATPAVDHHTNPLTRQRTNSAGHNMLARTRTRSNPKPPDHLSGEDPNFVPLHMFISFRNGNEIRFENIPQPAVDELEKRLKRLWPPGADHQAVGVGDWVVKFRESPWEMKTRVKEARYIILDLFTLFARRGYIFRTTINVRDQHPRLVFEASAIDPDSDFFLAFFSKAGRQFNLVNPPSHIDLSLGAHLKAVLPHRIARDEIEEDNDIRAIELKTKRYSAPVIEPSYFMMHIFKILNEMGFSLYASVPLARSSLLSFTPHQEMLVFRGRSLSQ